MVVRVFKETVSKRRVTTHRPLFSAMVCQCDDGPKVPRGLLIRHNIVVMVSHALR